MDEKTILLKRTPKERESRFLNSKFPYDSDYSHIYRERLEDSRSNLCMAIKKSSDVSLIRTIAELFRETGKSHVVIGIILHERVHYVNAFTKINVMEQLAEQYNHWDKYPDRKIYLEDNNYRIYLKGNINKFLIMPGAACAVRGKLNKNGYFYVEDLIYGGSGPQTPIQEYGNRCPFVIMSGLNYAELKKDMRPLKAFDTWICDLGHSFSRLIIAGNLIRSTPAQPEDAKDISDALCELDTLFTKWAKFVHVVVMPGPCDPVDRMLPQQPLPAFLFPKASRCRAFQCVTNPYSYSVDGILICGTSGQNIEDLRQYHPFKSSLDLLHATLVCGHIAPTAPETLPCVPFTDIDPFVIKAAPHVYFAGNMDCYDTVKVNVWAKQHTRIACVPTFSKTFGIAIIKLMNFSCGIRYFER